MPVNKCRNYQRHCDHVKNLKDIKILCYVFSIHIYIYILYAYLHIHTLGLATCKLRLSIITYIYILYIHMHTYIHTYIHACMHACMHTYIHTCIHTYTVISKIVVIASKRNKNMQDPLLGPGLQFVFLFDVLWLFLFFAKSSKTQEKTTKTTKKAKLQDPLGHRACLVFTWCIFSKCISWPKVAKNIDKKKRQTRQNCKTHWEIRPAFF